MQTQDSRIFGVWQVDTAGNISAPRLCYSIENVSLLSQDWIHHIWQKNDLFEPWNFEKAYKYTKDIYYGRDTDA